jgi:hypothetical protein
MHPEKLPTCYVLMELIFYFCSCDVVGTLVPDMGHLVTNDPKKTTKLQVTRS